MPVTVGDLVGSIIGAGPGEVVMHQNVSICQSLVTSYLPVILMGDLSPLRAMSRR
jgi:kynureninase